VRRMLTVQDWAAIAKGLQEGCSLRRTADRIGRSVSVVSREIRRNGGKCGYQPVWQLMRNTPETPDPGQRPAKFDATSGPQGPGAGGFEAFQDTPAKSSRGLRAETCDGSLEIRARAPQQSKGSSWCPTRPSTPGFYTPYRQAGSGPSQEPGLCSKRTRGSDASPSGAAHPPRFVGMVSTG